MTATNFSTNAPIHVGSGSVTRATVIAARQELVTAGAEVANRFGVVNPTAFSQLAEDTAIFAKLYSGIEPDFDGGVIQGLGGFQKIIETPTMPSTAIGYFGSKSSLLLAGRVPADPGMTVPGIPIPGVIETVADPDTGLSVQYRYFYDMAKKRLQLTMTLMYGVAVVQNGLHGLLLVT